MKIIVKSEKFRLWLWFPLSMLKTKMIRKGFCEQVLNGEANQFVSSYCKHDDDENLNVDQCDVAQEEESQQEEKLGLSVEVKKRNKREESSEKNDDTNSQEVQVDALDEKAMDEQLKTQFKQAYAILKQYVKQNGHFTLLEVDTADKETYVKITI